MWRWAIASAGNPLMDLASACACSPAAFTNKRALRSMLSSPPAVRCTRSAIKPPVVDWCTENQRCTSRLRLTEQGEHVGVAVDDAGRW